jgi:hypothetical protein
MGESGTYPTTIWTEVRRVGQADSEAAVLALDRLLQRYYSPLRQHLEYKFQLSEERAKDLLQSFVWKKVLLSSIISKAKAERGRFRFFLIRALDNFVRSEMRRREILTEPLEGEESEPGAPDDSTTRDPFDFAWAEAVLEQTLREMQAECTLSERGRQVWEVFEMRLLDPFLNGLEPIAYKEMIGRIGLTSDVEAGNCLVTAKRMFQQQLRVIIAEYVEDAREVEDEIQELMAIFAATPDRSSFAGFR